MIADRARRQAYSANWWAVLFKGMLLGGLLAGGCTTVHQVIVKPPAPRIVREMWLVPALPVIPMYVPPSDIGEA